MKLNWRLADPFARAGHDPEDTKMNSTQDKSARIRTFCSTAAVVPVLVVNDPASARPLADALVASGLPILEVTLRTEAALECIREMAQGDGVVGAGTVMTPRDVEAAVAAGARFAVSPGATDTLLDAAEDAGLPLLPGAATASEVMRLRERGYSMQKFFPAEASGGVTALKNLAGPLPQVSFCPTAGVSTANAKDYLSLPNVVCVGGSWVAPADAIAAGDWTRIETLALEGAALATA